MSFGNESGRNNQKMRKAGNFIVCKITNNEGLFYLSFFIPSLMNK